MGEVMSCAKESNTRVQSITILVKNTDEINLSLPFVKLFGMTSGASLRGKVGLILMRKSFSYFNFL